MVNVFFSIGSNLGDREYNLQNVIERFKSDRQVTVIGVSSVYETSPLGITEQPDFLNAVIQGTTNLSAMQLLDYVKDIEKDMGRIATVRWGPRIIDIDILLFDDIEMKTESLTIPHAEMKNRAFVLVPLAELVSDFSFPDGSRLADCLANLSGKDKVSLRKDIFLTY